MLRIRFDHRFERLADVLLDTLDAAEQGPFAERVVIVPDAGIGRWLQRRDARRNGVSARLRPELASRWLWQTMRSLLEGLPAHSPFEPERARWAILSLFEELPDDAQLALLRARLREPGSRARLVLADSVARLFERYLAWRRDWLARWQRGQWAAGDEPLGVHEPWQRWLWQRLVERLPGVREVHPYDQFVQCLAGAAPERIRAALGARDVALFGRVGLSPEQFALFGALSAAIDVSFFAPDPCRELWSDMCDAAQLARVRALRPDVAWLYEGEPSLLGNWGRAQREFVAQVLSLEETFGVQAEAPGREEERPFEPAAGTGSPPTSLQALQTAVFLRSDEPWCELRTIDSSILVLGAHGIVREAEVLHETLLDCFESMPGLEPQDVVVLCTDVDAAARAIEGVFESVPEARRIPIAINGRPARSDALVTAAQSLLAMAVRGIDASSLDEWLRNPAAMEALALDEAQVERLLAWFARAGGRRGLDAADGSPKHSMQAATDRLLLGAALGSHGARADVVADWMAIPGAQGSRSALLGAWLSLADALARLRTLAAHARSVHDWCEAFARIVEALFGETHRHAGGLQRVRDALVQLRAGAAGFAPVALDASAFEAALSDALEGAAAAAMPTGAVTVCPIGSLAGVPFRVICLFGMDEGAFPRRGDADEIDLMRRASRFGDRLVRSDDRGRFLDAVLAARDRFIVVCQSRDPRDDGELNPSQLVVELLAYLSARLAQGDRQAPLALARSRPGDELRVPALVEQPLHAFSPRGFAGTAPRYAAEWLPAACALAEPLPLRAPQIGALFDGDTAPPGAPLGEGRNPGTSGGLVVALAALAALADDAGAAIPLENLCRALADPARTWLRRSMGLALLPEPGLEPEIEPLWPDGDDRPAVQRCAERLLAGEDADSLVAEFALAPLTAAGSAGRRHAHAIVDLASELVGRACNASGARALGSNSGASRSDEPVVARVGEVLLRMPAPPLDAGGRALYVSAFPLGPAALVDAWLRTALWRFAVDASASGLLVTPDESIELHCREPLQSLEHALAWSSRIASEPLALFPRSWLRYAMVLVRPARGDESPAQRLRRAIRRGRDALSGTDADFGPTPELERPAERALYRDAQIDFEQVLPLCERVYRPILEDVTVHVTRRRQAR